MPLYFFYTMVQKFKNDQKLKSMGVLPQINVGCILLAHKTSAFTCTMLPNSLHMHHTGISILLGTLDT